MKKYTPVFNATDALFDMRAVRLSACTSGKQSNSLGKIGVIIGVHKPWQGFIEKEVHVEIRWADGTKSSHRQGRIEVIPSGICS